MGVEYRMLGPLEALVDGRSVGGLLAPSLSPSAGPTACKRGNTAGGDG